MKFTRKELRNRHRLSPRQGDDFLGEKQESADRPERMKKMQQLGYFLQLCSEMEKEKISPIVLKGPMLSDRLYGDPFYRTSNDFDLLFKEKDLSRAMRFFEKKGFYGLKFKWPGSEKRQQLAIKLTNQHVVYHPELHILIEIHWRLFEKRFTDHGQVQRLVNEHTITHTLNGQPYKHLTDEFELLYLIIHGSMHAWFRLKWLVDIQKILETKAPDETIFNLLVNQLGAERFVSVCNEVLAEYYPNGKRLPGTWKKTKSLSDEALLQIARPNNDPFDTVKNTIKLVRYQIRLSPKMRYKQDILRVMFFNKKDLEIDWLPPYSPVIYLFRPVSFTLRKCGFL